MNSNSEDVQNSAERTNNFDRLRLLSTREVSELTGLAVSTLEKRRLAGEKPRFIKLGPRRVGYDPADIEAWIEEQRRSSTSDDGTA